MQHLPQEIQSKIFESLNQEDQAECMTVCWKWAHLIKSSALFRTVHIYSEEQYTRLTEKARQEPDLASRTEYLILHASYMDQYDIDILPTLLPNVRHFTFPVWYGHYFLPRGEPPALHPWRDSIEYLNEVFSQTHTQRMMSHTLCTRLTTLFLRGNDGRQIHEIVHLFANAPALRTLGLYEFCIRLLDFEILHTHLPHLSTFILTYVEINSEIFPSTINPAPSLTEFKTSRCMIDAVSDGVKLLQYMKKKYPRILKLAYDFALIQSLDFKLYETYNSELVSYMNAYASQLCYLNVGFDGIGHPFLRVLDTPDCRISELHLTGITRKSIILELCHLKHARYIQTLSLDVRCCHEGDLTGLNAFTALKELNIGHWESLIEQEEYVVSEVECLNLNLLLEQVGATLEKLVIENYRISFDVATSRPYPLKCLCINRVSLAEDVDQFISQSFHQLRVLRLTLCDLGGRQFSLQDSHLLKLEIKVRFPTENDRLLVKTKKEQRWYWAQRSPYSFGYDEMTLFSDTIIYPAVKSIPFTGISGESFIPFITFECHSLSSLLLVNLW